MTWPVIETVGLAVTLLVLLYYYSKSKLEYWHKRGIKGPKPLPFVGNFKDVYLGKACVNECFEKAYYKFRDEPVVGLYVGHKPLLLLRDPDIIKTVLIKDFPVFVDRTFHSLPSVEPLSEHLFLLEASKWRPLRARLSPVFTSGKLKEMFHLLVECADHFETYLDNLVKKGEFIECRDIAAKYTTDVIGSCAFGIEMNSLAPEDSEFRRMGKMVFQTSFKSMMRDRLRDFPWLYKIFGPFTIDRQVDDFFTRITKESIDYRIKNNVRRCDFVDTLVDLKEHPEKLGQEFADDTFLAAQAFVFFAAGFETSSLTIGHLLIELAKSPSIQERVRAEVLEVLAKHNGVITYDSIKEMKYLDACFQETLRKDPLLMWLSRKALRDYTFPGTKISIEKGQQVYLPVRGIQRDPEIYPDPDKFDPERFTNEQAKTRHPMFYLPFGDGPRNCIGARFARYQSKVALITVLSKFRIEECEKTFKEYDIDKKSLFFLQPTHGLYVKMTRLEA
ncbi:putative cytochrome P450 6a14 [Eufriesea mexicana]|uniref:Putative cytochrome P450 6a14 n=1 Tax=Eufriesea mexicana TaxID=516756 RepID=A0A310SPL8_9HYME|nr:PREDICTED: probable cytochrome P450 6a14 [Eufriesea mexicana]OAD56571.1 putative cytochrome P450 6a14 [Eufriesea mexicana]